jgi:hypothetical protein
MPTPSESPLVFAERVLAIRPHAGQVAFLVDDHPVRVVVGGRRAGQSLCLAVDMAWQLVRQRVQEQPHRVLITAPVMDQAKVLLGYVARLLREAAVGGLVDREVESPYPEIRLGRDVAVLVRAASEGGKHLRGHGVHAIVVDEAGFLAEQVIEEAITPMLADYGGRLTLSSTPTVRGGLLHRLFERGLGADARRLRNDYE